jgi:superfamily II DNA or RNA helicase
MWSTIPSEDYKNFINRYIFLDSCKQDLILKNTNGKILLPWLMYKNYPYKSLTLLEDKKHVSKPANIEFTGTLRDYQEEAMNVVRQKLANTGYLAGIVEGKAGSGKTVITAYISSLLKLKTLIIVDNTKLAEQFIETYLKVTNVTSIGLIKATKFDVEHDVTVATVQTLMRKLTADDPEVFKEFYINMRNAGYGLLVWDEAHKSASAIMYAKSSLCAFTKNRIGLTATPPQNNTHSTIITSVLGNNIVKMTMDGYTPCMHFIKYNSGVANPSLLTKVYNSGDDGYIKMLAMYNKRITDSTKWVSVIKDIAIKCIQKNHRVIIMVSTLKQLDIIVSVLNSNGLKATPLHAKQTKVDKDNDKLLVATQSFVSAGFDYKELSALIQACPSKGRTYTIQSTGRILRLCDNKVTPEIYDLIDIDLGNIFIDTIDIKKNIMNKEYSSINFSIERV